MKNRGEHVEPGATGAPQIAFGDRKAALSPAKRAVLERWTEARDLRAGRVRTVEPRPADAPVPLASGQRRLWDFERQHPQRSSALNLFYLLRIRGQLDVEALRGSLDEIVRRHETLRSRFVDRGSGPRVELEPESDVEMPIVGLKHQGDDRAEQEAVRRGCELGRQPFDIRRGPLHRFVLYRIAPDHFVLLMAVHHIVFDEWSMGIVLRELAALYPAFRGGRAPTLGALPVQFSDFAYWEQRWLGETELEGQLAHWREQLSGELPRLRLPGRKDVRGGATHGRLPARFEDGLSARVSAFARSRNASPFMVLLAALCAALFRLTGERDFVIGNPAANRNYGGVRDLIGFFVNNLPMRIRLPSGATFEVVLEAARSCCTRAYANQEVPTSRIAATRGEGASQGDLLQLVFSFQNSPVPEAALEGLDLDPLVLDYGMTTVDVAMFLIDAGALTGSRDELAGMIHYNASVYDESAIADLWRTFVRVTRESLERPDEVLSPR